MESAEYKTNTDLSYLCDRPMWGWGQFQHGVCPEEFTDESGEHMCACPCHKEK